MARVHCARRTRAQGSRSRANHRHIIDPFRVELGRHAEADAGFGIRGPLQHRPIGADHQRQLIGEYAEALHHGAAICIVGSVQHCMGVAIAAEEALQSDEIRPVRIADKHGPDPAP